MFVRDDDVFLLIGRYKTHKDVVERFKQVHNIIAKEGAVHIVALICGTLNQFPGGLDFLKQVYAAEEIIPEIHGWRHIDYKLLSSIEINDHLKRCIDFIQLNFDYQPTKFYTPWGANAGHINETANNLNLQMIDCSKILYPKRKIFNGKMWKEYSDVVRSGHQELFIHWHEDKWFNTESHSLVKTLRTIREDRKCF